MNTEERAQCLVLLAELFPKSELTNAELEAFSSSISRFSREIAISAIKNHRMECEYSRPKFKQILAQCYAQERSVTERSGEIVHHATPMEQLAARLECSVTEAVMRYCRYWYCRYAKRAGDDDQALAQAEQRWKRECRFKLAGEADVIWEAACRTAEWVTATKGEFETAMQDLRNNGIEQNQHPTDQSQQEVIDTIFSAA